MTSSLLADAAARDVIRHDLDRTLFVEAGAGSGKTGSLVGRVVSIVLDGGVPLRHVAAVTFTEKAGAELRDRLRAEFERVGRQAADAGKAERRRRAEEALDDLDTAAIGTLHSFAQRVLGEHPVEAGIPPLLEVSDEVSSQVALEARWSALQASMLGDHDLRRPLLLALAAGVKMEQHLRSIAREFNSEWDRLDEAVLRAGPPAVPAIDTTDLVRQGRITCEMKRHCVAADDNMVRNLGALADWLVRLETAPDDPARLEILAQAAALKSGNGRTANWRGCNLADVKSALKALQASAAELHGRVLDKVLRRLAYRIAEAAIEGARARQAEGRLEFHDLLVLARELLRSPEHGEAVRAELADKYQRLLLDEFQDTDPIQNELAVRIAGGAAAGAEDWHDVVVPDGRLFIVGDPKQSIYRFRRADICAYLDAQSRLGSEVGLTTNFRTTPAVLAWDNAVFSRLIRREPGSQPPYQALDPHRQDAPGGTRVLLLGDDPHAVGLKADDVRELEAADVAGAIRRALDEKWQVCDDERGEWRDVVLDDIAVLLPARTSLPQLEQALDRAGIPYRAEASSLVYRTAEVRDLLMTARAVDDPSDSLALVAALRSPVFGCGDDDLWTWKAAGGSFNLLATAPEAVSAEHPVREAVDYLQGLHRLRVWKAPSELLDRIVRDRRMLEAGTDGPRARDVWRRLRFVVDQARAWSEAQAGGLRAYLEWAYRQGDESSRVAEAVLPETDTRAVRILTIHSAKGLEFPVVIVSGLSSKPGGANRGVEVLWPATGGYEVRLNKALQTGDFEIAKPIDEQMDYHERLRLLYVACTRARDHLVVSLHRVTRAKLPDSEKVMTNAELLAEACRGAPGGKAFSAPPDMAPLRLPSDQVPAVSSYAEWQAGVEQSQAAARRPTAISASSLEGSLVAPLVAPPPGLEKGPRNLELPPWNKGRYGTAIGRAVHGALQTVNLATGEGLEAAVAAQVLAEGVLDHQEVVMALCRSALGSETVRRAASRPHWRETYVGTTLDDGTVLEGFIDLVYEQDDGSLVIVDYKTDAVPAAALPARVAVYLPQMAAYAEALSQATRKIVAATVLVFLAPGGAAARPLTARDWATAPPLIAVGTGG